MNNFQHERENVWLTMLISARPRYKQQNLMILSLISALFIGQLNELQPYIFWKSQTYFYIKILDLSFTLWIDICIKMNLILELSHHEVYKPYDKYQEITWIFSRQARYFNHMHFKTKYNLIYALGSKIRINYRPMNRRQDSKWM